MTNVDWGHVETLLRPLLRSRVPAEDVADVLQDVYVKLAKTTSALRDQAAFDRWLRQIAFSVVADHGRRRKRHPLPKTVDHAGVEQAAEPTSDIDPADHYGQLLAACVRSFVDLLDEPYRQAVTLVDLEGKSMKAAATAANVSTAAMKSRAQRGRVMLRQAITACCQIELDQRNRIVDVVPRSCSC